MTEANIDLVAGKKKKKKKTEMKWEREVECVMKQKSLSFEDAVNRQVWRKATESQ
jgi:hypothetical protein